MDIDFDSNKLAKTFAKEKNLLKEYGGGRAILEEIKARIAEFKVADSLADIPKLPAPPRCHELKHGGKGRFAVNVGKKKRLIFTAQEGVPRRTDGRPEWSEIKAIRILGVIDYHKKA